MILKYVIKYSFSKKCNNKICYVNKKNESYNLIGGNFLNIKLYNNNKWYW